MKTVLCFAVLGGLSLSNAFALETGFETGNSFTATEYRGSVTVICMDPTDHGSYSYSCRDEELAPAIQSAFVTQPGLNADRVTVASTWESGKTVTKDSRFDASSGKSTSTFNLWIRTLFQRPLLSYGENRIHYTLSKDGQPQAEGDLIATVQKAPVRQCRHGIIVEHGVNSCRDGSWMCRRYFDEAANCGSGVN